MAFEVSFNHSYARLFKETPDVNKNNYCENFSIITSIKIIEIQDSINFTFNCLL